MSDYKELYFKLFRATEDAIQILIAAQRDCEEGVLSSPESEITVLFSEKDSPQDSGEAPQ